MKRKEKKRKFTKQETIYGMTMLSSISIQDEKLQQGFRYIDEHLYEICINSHRVLFRSDFDDIKDVLNNWLRSNHGFDCIEEEFVKPGFICFQDKGGSKHNRLHEFNPHVHITMYAPHGISYGDRMILEDRFHQENSVFKHGVKFTKFEPTEEKCILSPVSYNSKMEDPLRQKVDPDFLDKNQHCYNWPYDKREEQFLKRIDGLERYEKYRSDIYCLADDIILNPSRYLSQDYLLMHPNEFSWMHK